MKNLYSFEHNKGSALIVSLVFLMVLTIAGLAAMRMASLEENMAANSQASGYVFQQAQSEIQTQLRYFASVQGRNALNALDYPTMDKETNANRLKFMPDSASRQVGLTEVAGLAVTDVSDRKLNFVRDGHCTDGSSVDQFICIEFEMEIEAELDNGARTKQAQGFTFKNNISDGN